MKNYMLPIMLFIFILSLSGFSKAPEANAHTALFNNIPRVMLVAQENHVLLAKKKEPVDPKDPKTSREAEEANSISPDAMLASILEVLELNISKLVITMPKPLAEALEKTKKGEQVSAVPPKTSTPASTSTPSNKKEQLVLDLGGARKIIAYEPLRSFWGMIFMVREIFNFVETEAKKQKLKEKFKGGEEPLEWEKIEYAAINAMLSVLDSHSAFLEPKYARDLTLTTKGEFGGVGIVISIRDGFLTVISPIDGTPAAIAGVKREDKIVKINENSAINMPLEDAVSELRGPPNSTVKITVRRANSQKELDFELKRQIIKVDSVAHMLLNNSVGYVRIKAFQGNTASDVQAAILAMKKESKNKMAGIILDLRDNPGGLLREAVSISDLFLSGGEIVSTQGAQKESRQVEIATPGEVDENLKIVVLVNGGSASASEIVSGAIKYGGPHENGPDQGRGIVIGDSPTFGKGSVQMLFDFPSLNPPENKEAQLPVQPAALKLTIAQYYAPQGRIIQTVGIKPDILITPVHADKPKELSLFQSLSRREIDLDAHLVAAKNCEEKSLSQISFLAPPRDEEVNEYGKLNKDKLKSEFIIKLASDFIMTARGHTRKDLLAVSAQVKSKLDNLEQKKIIKALKKYNINWSKGKALSDKNALKISLASNNSVIAGEKLKVAIKIKNTSKKPVYQVHGITHSKTDIFDHRELLFGKLNAGQEIERSLEFDIPKDVVTRKDLMKVEIKDIAHEKISELNIPLTIKGLARPRFAHMVYVDDGHVQKDEEVELVVWIKNIGDGKAFEPTVLLRNDSGSKIFLKTGREKAKELLPNQETSMRFSFRVKEPTDKADFELQVFDGQMHDVWRDKITIPINNAPRKLLTKAQANTAKIISKATVSLLAKPQAGAQVLATLKEGLRCTPIMENADYYLLKVENNLVGFVKKSDLKDASELRESTQQVKGNLFAINYDRVPAQVALKFSNGEGWTLAPSGELTAQINNAERVSEVLLYVNGKKVLYQAVNKPNAQQKIAQNITLKPGMNVISLVAREDSRYGQRESITVYYDENKLTLAKPKAAPKANLQ